MTIFIIKQRYNKIHILGDQRYSSYLEQLNELFKNYTKIT